MVCHQDAELQGHLTWAGCSPGSCGMCVTSSKEQTGDEKCQHIYKLPTEQERPPQ